MQFKLLVGDIFEQQVEAIVNPAHPSLRAGSGLCGEIFRRAGKRELETYCLDYLAKEGLKSLPLGDAVVTPAFNLPFKAIIHTSVTKFFKDGSAKLSDCYRNVLAKAHMAQLTSVVIPALGIGVNQIPVEVSGKAFRKALNELPTDWDITGTLVVRELEILEIFERAAS